jgi:eukaryotic-like serine/threonine-protein kinase
MEHLIGQTFDRYQILELLGQGGMGAVFKARDLVLKRDVALKVLHPHLASNTSLKERFLQEAQTAAQLDNPCIVKVYDFGQSNNLLYIVMEFILVQKGTNEYIDQVGDNVN